MRRIEIISLFLCTYAGSTAWAGNRASVITVNTVLTLNWMIIRFESKKILSNQYNF